MNRPDSATPADRRVTDAKPSARHVLDTAHLVRAEYLEMPGLGLTAPQVARAFTVTLQESERTLARLVEEGLLTRDSHGAYRLR